MVRLQSCSRRIQSDVRNSLILRYCPSPTHRPPPVQPFPALAGTALCLFSQLCNCPISPAIKHQPLRTQNGTQTISLCASSSVHYSSEAPDFCPGGNTIHPGCLLYGYIPAHPPTGTGGHHGNFNATHGHAACKRRYVDIIKGIVAKMAARGVYTLLDMHQDVLSSEFCLYDGMPLWVVNKSTARHAFPWPFAGNCSSRGWETNILTEAAAQVHSNRKRGGLPLPRLRVAIAAVSCPPNMHRWAQHTHTPLPPPTPFSPPLHVPRIIGQTR